MKFQDIQYYKRGGSTNSGLGHVLPGGNWIHKHYFENAWRQVLAQISGLFPGPKYCAEELYGKASWQLHKCGPRLKLGRCIKYFVVNKMLPLQEANPTKKGKRKYVYVKASATD